MDLRDIFKTGLGREGGGTSLRARSLAAEFGRRVGWGGAVRELVRCLDPGT